MVSSVTMMMTMMMTIETFVLTELRRDAFVFGVRGVR